MPDSLSAPANLTSDPQRPKRPAIGTTAAPARTPVPAGTASPAGTATPGLRSFPRRWFRAVLLGLPGIVMLAVQFVPPQAALPPGLRDASPVLLALLAALNPLLLLMAAAAVGAAVAPGTGLRSIVASAWRPRPDDPTAWTRLAPHLPVAFACGLGVAVLLHLGDRAFTPLLGEQWAAVQARATGPVSLGGLATGIFYGGFTEEVMMRWGVMGLVVWLALRLPGQRSRAPTTGVPPPVPGPIAAWIGIVVAAALFGAGHLPAVAMLSELTPLLIVRTVGLNLVGGLVYGWLFWRRNLESAIAAHAATHVGFALLRWSGL